MKHIDLKIYVMTALIAAICVIGSWIKIPVGVITTAALDSAPAFLSVLFLPPLFSGFAGALGHLATAYNSGMPFGVFHLLIAVEMFLIVYIFNILHRKKFDKSKWLFLIIANGVLSPLPFYFIISPAFYISSLPGLIIATVINVVIVYVLMPLLKPIAQRLGWSV